MNRKEDILRRTIKHIEYSAQSNERLSVSENLSKRSRQAFREYAECDRQLIRDLESLIDHQ
ncbi:hypothetical protein [Endozoicomonas euniceicola]|uniref:Uncharacterized protein n=1 Tax=Endozoicomonas euniceicola TaxID=1234143 RepID=A0ABY6GNH9_9GAMM|nr:hypothetical protein [Endozoicomonas euniceicola]UYM14283.1 hypothetical protein NX720_15400 [Endozoicomonas euniceicola]